MTTASFKAASAADFAAVRDLVREFYTHEGLDLNDHVLPALLKLLRTEALGRVWLIRAEGRDAGYMILTFGYDIEFGGPVATLTDLYLKPEFRGRGIGTAAFGLLEVFCRERGLNALELQVLHHNAAAQRLYSRLGFELLDRRPMHKRILPG